MEIHKAAIKVLLALNARHFYSVGWGFHFLVAACQRATFAALRSHLKHRDNFWVTLEACHRRGRKTITPVVDLCLQSALIASQYTFNIRFPFGMQHSLDLVICYEHVFFHRGTHCEVLLVQPPPPPTSHLKHLGVSVFLYRGCLYAAKL